MKDWFDLKKEVIDKELCCLCGTCIGVCPTQTLAYVDGEIVNEKNLCIGCGQCLATCPGKEFDYILMNQKIHGMNIEEINLDFGFYKTMLKGYSKDFYIREHASSGGLATALGCFLLEKGYVDYVIGITGKTGKYEVKALKTKEDVLDTMQSKYIFVPVNEIISFVLKNKGKYFYVGLPCEIQGLRKAAEKNRILKDRIFLCAAIFCGFNMTRDATDFLIQKSGIKKENITQIEYRGRKEGKTGCRIYSEKQDFFISKHGYTILNIFYSKERCWKCFDLTGEFSDISFGDAWEMGEGWSRIIIRTEQADMIISEMINENLIHCEVSKEDDIYSSQKKLINYKKRTIGIREKSLSTFPKYGISMPEVTCIKKIKAILFLCFLKFGKTKMAHRLLKIIPIRFLEKISEFVRNGVLSEILLYTFWGIVTVCTSFFSYWFLIELGLNYKTANVYSIVITKIIAYLSNKYFVFHSKCSNMLELLKEVIMFIVTRALSGLVEFLGLIILVEICKIDELFGKANLIFITTVINYFCGKKIVYERRKN